MFSPYASICMTDLFSLIYFIHSVSSTPWAEGPPSSLVELWVSHLLYFSSLYYLQNNPSSISSLCLHQIKAMNWLWWEWYSFLLLFVNMEYCKFITPTRSRTPCYKPSYCLSALTHPLTSAFLSPSLIPLLWSGCTCLHTTLHTTLTGAHRNLICCCLCQQFPFGSVSVAIITPCVKRHATVNAKLCYHF